MRVSRVDVAIRSERLSKHLSPRLVQSFLSLNSFPELRDAVPPASAAELPCSSFTRTNFCRRDSDPCSRDPGLKKRLCALQWRAGSLSATDWEGVQRRLGSNVAHQSVETRSESRQKSGRHPATKTRTASSDDERGRFPRLGGSKTPKQGGTRPTLFRIVAAESHRSRRSIRCRTRPRAPWRRRKGMSGQLGIGSKRRRVSGA
jgi:hypothetical protein